MNNYSRVVDKDGQVFENSDQPRRNSGSSCTAMDEAKGVLADKLDGLATTIRKKTAGREEQSDLASYGNEASEILQHTAAYVREFDYDKTEAEFRGYIRQQPGKSMMIAAGIGLLLGIVLRRR